MNRTRRVFFLVVFCAALCWAQKTVDTVPFRATLTTANQVPPVTGVDASGSVTFLLHLTRIAGQISHGVVDFDVDFTTATTEVVGLRIHRGAAGANGTVVITTDLTANNRFNHSGGLGRLNKQVVIRDAALLTGILTSPDQFYVNLATAVNPDGLIRGQLARAEVLVMRAHMSPLNEVPPFPEVNASGSANIIALGVRNASGEIVEGSVRFDVNYRFAAPDGIASGLHIHNGPEGVNMGVVIQPNPGVAVAQGIAIEAGVANITRTSAGITTGAALIALRNLFAGQAAGHYANLHSSAPGHGGGVIRGQLLYTGNVTLRMNLSPGNEVPPATGLNAEAPATLTIYVNRNQAGQVTAGAVVFDVNHEYASQTEFLGLEINRGAAGTVGPVVIDSGLRPQNRDGTGNFFQIVNVSPETPEALEALNGLLANPDRYYLNIRTTAHPTGAVRSQLAAAVTTPPSISPGGIVTAALDPSIAAASPGALIAIFGQDLIKTPLDVTSGLGLEGPFLPITLNGMDVRIGGRLAPILFANRTQINVQVPFEVEPGNRQVFVVRSGDFSAPVNLQVGPFSPAIFVTSLGAAVLKNNDFSLVSATNPARPNDTLLIFGTGLGTVRPAVPSGAFAPSLPVSLTLVDPTATIGGVRAEVIATALSPGFAGLYQVAVQMPQGVPVGPQEVVITVGGLRSNAAPMAVGLPVQR